MKKKLTIALSAVALLVAVSIAVICLLPSSASADDSKTTVSMTKVTSDEGILGTYDLSLDNMKVKYVDDQTYIHLHIESFDGMTNIYPASNHITDELGNVYGELIELRENDVFYNGLCRVDEGGLPRLLCDFDFDRWAITAGPYVAYVGSVSGDYTVEELVAFFRLGVLK